MTGVVFHTGVGEHEVTQRNEALLVWAKTATDAQIDATGTTRDYLKQIAWGHKTASVEMAVRIETASRGAATRQQLRPDDWRELWPELAGGLAAEEKPLIHTSLFRALEPIEKQCVLDAVREAVGTSSNASTASRARLAARAALAGVATLRGNDGPVVFTREGQGRRELANELEKAASQLRADADEWDAEMEAIARNATSALRSSVGGQRSASQEVRSPDPKRSGRRDQGASNE